MFAQSSPIRVTAFAAAVLLAVAIGSPSPQAAPAAAGDRDVRALWVTRATLGSPDAVTKMVAAARAGGFNTLLVQVRGRGDAYYRSTLEPRAAELAGHPDFDPLGVTIAEAHAAGLRVHAWIAVNLISSAATLPSSREHIVYRNPEWLMVPRPLAMELRGIDTRSPEYLGRLARWSRQHADDVEGLYASPIHPAAAAHVAAVVKELVTSYALDGVHLDYVRFPAEDFDYSRGALQQFKLSVQPDLTPTELQTLTAREALDPFAYPNFFPERWKAFRRSRLTALVMRVRTAVKAARPDAILSAAVIPDAAEALQSRLQDWRTWLDQSLIDVLCPMAYTTDPRMFEAQVSLAEDYAGGRPVWTGIGAYRLPSATTLQFIAAARRLGTAGVILFSYDALTAPPYTATTVTDIGRAAFGAGSY
ncbi:MAG TPA: family 10 glycosylhydrolase [Vicinamibacterales bacterium]|nr:family 10 glycosylhydrolase [Vicinamibacterales bacterium]